MIEIEPKTVSFQNLRLNQIYNSSICLTNPLSAAVDLHIRTSSPVLSVQPTKIHLSPRQSIVLSVRLHLNHVPSQKPSNYYVQIKSSFFDQKIPVDITMAQIERRSRSSSPAHRTSATAHDREQQGTIVRELTLQLASKDEKLKQLEDVVGNLQSKNPNFQNILDFHLDEQRKSFDEKSAKILAILRKKDDKIEELSDQVAKQNEAIEAYRHQAKSAVSQAKPLEPDSGRQKSPSRTHTSMTNERELHALREKTMDQNDQIEVLIQEISKIKNDRKEGDQQLNQAHAEAAHLRREMEKLQLKLKAVEITAQQQEQELLAATQKLQHRSFVDREDHSKENQHPQFEIQAEGGLATATPRVFQVRETLSEREAKRLGEAAEAHYRALVEDLEQRCSDLQQSLRAASDDKLDLSRKLEEMETERVKTETENRVLRDRIQQVEHIQRDFTFLQQPNQTSADAPAATPEASMATQRNNEHRAHQWWAYIWHMLSAKYGDERNLNMRQAGDFLYEPKDDVEAGLHQVKLRENLRMQAIDLSAARQEILGLKLRHRQENDDAQTRLDELQRENARLGALLKNSATQKETKLSEMAATIKVLSARSDLHSQLAAARSEIEVEKLASLHLRLDLDESRNEVHHLHRRLQGVSEDMTKFRGKIESVEILRTYEDIPGVNPLTALEVCGDEIYRTRASVTEHQKELTAAKDQIEKLQRQVSRSTNNTVVSVAESKNTAVGKGGGTVASRRSFVSGRTVASSASATGATSIPAAIHLGSTPTMTMPEGEVDDDLDASVMRPESQAFDDISELDRLVIDESTTPKQLLRAMDVATMRNRIALQNSTIVQLRKQVEELSRPHPLTKDTAQGLEVVTGEELIDLQNRSKKLEAVQTRVTEAHTEMEKLRAENLQLQKRINDLTRAKVAGDDHYMFSPSGNINSASASGPRRHDVSDHHSSDPSSLDVDVNLRVEELSQALENKDRLLRDRTTQLKVLMDSFDALQMPSGIDKSNVTFDSSAGAAGLGTSFSALEELAYDRHQSQQARQQQQKPWITQSLVKRIVELTVQTTSLLAQTDLEAKRVSDLEYTVKTITRQVNKANAEVFQLENENARLKAAMEGLKEEVRSLDDSKLDNHYKANQDTTALLNTLQETEASLQDSLLQIDELKLLNRSLATKDEEWMLQQLRAVLGHRTNPLLGSASSAVLEDGSAPSSPAKLYRAGGDLIGGVGSAMGGASDGVDANESAVSKVVEQFINSLRQQHNIQITPLRVSTFASINATAKLSKQEEKFYQRISDLVLAANRAASHAERQRLDVDARNTALAAENTQLRAHITAFATSLYQVRKQVLVYEQLVRTQRAAQLTKQSRLVTNLRAALDQERKQTRMLHTDLAIHRRKTVSMKTDHQLGQMKLRKLQAQVAVLETKGSTYLQAKEDVTAQLSSRIQTVETSFQQWFRAELPRILAGVPLIEDALSNLNPLTFEEFSLNQQQASTSATSNIGNNMGSITQKLLHQSGLDRSFALTSALCAAKASQSAQQLHLDDLKEQLQLQKQRNLVLEGVVMKWQDELRQRPYQSPRRQTDEPQDRGRWSIDDLDPPRDDVDDDVFDLLEKERGLLDSNERLVQRVQELEEDIIEYKGRLEQAEAQTRLTKNLLESTYAQDEWHKTNAMQQMSRLRVDLEKEHAEELRSLREVYEKERDEVMQELQVAAQYVDDSGGQGAGGSATRVIGERAWDARADDRVRRSVVDNPLDHRRRRAASSSRDSRDKIKSSKSMSVSRRRGAEDEEGEEDDKRHSTADTPHASLEDDEGVASRPPLSRTSREFRKQDGYSDEENAAYNSDPPRHTRQRYNYDDNDDDEEQQPGPDDEEENSQLREMQAALQALTQLSDHSSAVQSMHSATEAIHAEYLQRAAKLNERKLREAKSEVKELRNLVRVLQEQLSEVTADLATHPRHGTKARAKHQGRRRMNAGDGDLPDSSFSTSSSTSSHEGQDAYDGVVDANRAKKPRDDVVRRIATETRKENPALWPGIVTLTQELTELLSTLLQRVDADSSIMDLIHAAVAMTQRIRLSARRLPSGHGSGLGIAGAEAAAGFPKKMSSQDDYHPKDHSEDDKLFQLSEHELPERYQFLLRDLRRRLTEMEGHYHDQLQEERLRWATERASLMHAKDQAEALCEEVSRSKETAVAAVKDRYEQSLRQTQEALEGHTETTKREIARLEETLRTVQQSYAQEKDLRQVLEQRLQQAQQQVQQQQAQQQAQQQNQASTTASLSTHSEDFVQMQRLLTATQDALEQSQAQVRQTSRQYTTDIDELRHNFQRFREAHEAIVSNLEEQLETQSLPPPSLAPPLAPSHPYAYHSSGHMEDMSMLAGDFSLMSHNNPNTNNMHPSGMYPHPQAPPSTNQQQLQQQVHQQQQVVIDLEERLRKLDYKYKIKCSELDAVLKVVSKPPDTNAPATASSPAVGIAVSADNPAIKSTGSGEAPVPLFDSSVVREIQAEMQSGRLQAAEHEITYLQRQLRYEQAQSRRLQQQLGNTSALGGAKAGAGGSVEGFDNANTTAATVFPASPPAQPLQSSSATDAQATLANAYSASGGDGGQGGAGAFLRDYYRDFVLPVKLVAPETSAEAQTFLRRINTMRKRAVQEINDLQRRLQETPDAVPKLKLQVQELRSQLNQQKDEMTRKTKVLAALRESKQADANALEQWKHEARGLEESLKRLQRTLASKDALVRDLKARIESLESALDKATNEDPLARTAGGGTAEEAAIYQLSPQELRTRLKEYDLERARHKAHLQALRDKLQDQQTQLQQLTQQNQDLQKLNEKYEASKVALARKDTQILSLRNQLDARTQELQTAQQQDLLHQQEADKRVRSLQRQVDQALRQQDELARETALLRQRVVAQTQQVVREEARGVARAYVHNHPTSNSSNNRTTALNASGRGSNNNHASSSTGSSAHAPAGSIQNPTAIARMTRSVAFAPINQQSNSTSNNATNAAQIHMMSALYDDDDEHEAGIDANRQSQYEDDHHAREGDGGGGGASLVASTGGFEMDSLMDSLGLSSHPPQPQQPAQQQQQQQPPAPSVPPPPLFPSAVGSTSDLLARLTGLSHLLPTPSTTNTPLHDTTNLHSTPGSLMMSSSSSSSSSAAQTGGGSVAGSVSSAEQRLQALVDAALMSPVRR